MTTIKYSDIVDTAYEFEGVVRKVEERFAKVYDGDAMKGGDGQPGKIEGEDVSTGWWVVLAGWPVALRFGTVKPHIAPGDTIVMCMKRKPKP